MIYNTYQHVLLPLAALAVVAFMFFWYSPANAPTEETISDAERGCVASAYQATKNGEDLEANLDYCYDEL